MNEKNETMTDQLPDRLSTDRKARSTMKRFWRAMVGIRFRAPRKPTSKNIASARLDTRDRRQRERPLRHPLTIKSRPRRAVFPR